MSSLTPAPELTGAAERQRTIDLLNDALSGEYHSFVGHVLRSNPYVVPGTEKDLDTLGRIRDEEDANVKALLTQLGRLRAGPTLQSFRWWKHDLNFLGLDFLVIQAAGIARDEAARVARLAEGLPDDAELRATFESVVATKRRHAEELAKLAATRSKERQARRDAARKLTAIPLKKGAAPAAANPAAAAAPGSGAPKGPPLPGAPKAPSLPGAPKPPSPPLPGTPKPPSPPLPGGSKPSSPPLPPGAPKPPGAPRPPAPPSPPAAASAESAAAPAPAAPAPPAAKPGHPPLPPGFKLPPKRG